MPASTPPGTPAEPLVSVVIATNRPTPFLREALGSVHDQSYPSIETVLVDDGSPDPDGLRLILADFPDVRLIRQRRAGVCVARNLGVSHTSGEYLVFLDDDDRWHVDRIARQVAALESAPDAVAAYCGLRTVDEDGHELAPADQRQVRDVHEVLRRETGIILPNLMVRRSTFERVGGFHPAFRLAEDLDLVYRMAIEGPFRYVGGTLVDYRKHTRNLTSAHRPLCRSIDRVLNLHRWSALENGRTDLVADIDASLRRNGRFAVWSALRAARADLGAGRPGSALAELAWGLSFAPSAPWHWAADRLRRLPAHVRRSPARTPRAADPPA